MLSAPSIAPLIPTSHPLPNGNTLFLSLGISDLIDDIG